MSARPKYWHCGHFFYCTNISKAIKPLESTVHNILVEHTNFHFRLEITCRFLLAQKQKIDKDHFCTAIEIEKTFGKPSIADTIILKKGMKLYEFQGELERILPQKDSLKVLQYVFCNGDLTTVIWLVPSGKK